MKTGDLFQPPFLPLKEDLSTEIKNTISILSRLIALHGDKNDFDIEDEEHAVEELSSTYENILSKTQQGKIKVYRMICLDDRESIDKNQLGVSWSSYSGSAACWNEEGGNKYLLTGLVSPLSINWLETLYHQLHSDFYDESEVRLKPNQPIYVMSVNVYTGRNWQKYMDGFKGSTGTKYYNDAANRGSDFVAWSKNRLTEEKVDDIWSRAYKEGNEKGFRAGKSDIENRTVDKSIGFHNPSKRGRITKANVSDKAFAAGYQDGYYDAVTGGYRSGI